MHAPGLPDRSVGVDHARFPFPFRFPLPSPRPPSSHTPRPTDPGTIPDCIGSDLTSLEWLDLATNKLDGTITQSLCLLGDSLTDFLKLNHNKLTGRIPDCFGTSFPNLATMQLQDNSLTGGLPQTWSPTNALNSLMVSNNPDLGG